MAEPKRRAALLNRGQRLKSPIPTETRPDDYDEEKWLGLVHDYAARIDRSCWPTKREEEAGRCVEEESEPLDEAARKKIEVAVNRVEMGARRSSAAGDQPLCPPDAGRSVDSERLARFVAELPAWIQTRSIPAARRGQAAADIRLSPVFPPTRRSVRRGSHRQTPKARSAGPGRPAAGAVEGQGVRDRRRPTPF